MNLIFFPVGQDLFYANLLNATIYYATKDNYWNNEFIDKFAFNESKIINCKILDLVQIKIN